MLFVLLLVWDHSKSFQDKKITTKYNLKIIIDAACAFGNKYYDKSLSKFADIVVYSFNAIKILLQEEVAHYLLIKKMYLQTQKFCQKMVNLKGITITLL